VELQQGLKDMLERITSEYTTVSEVLNLLALLVQKYRSAQKALIGVQELGIK
jgi:hypothetical protein